MYCPPFYSCVLLSSFPLFYDKLLSFSTFFHIIPLIEQSIEARIIVFESSKE